MTRWYTGWMASWLVVGCVGGSKEIGATVSATAGESESESESESDTDADADVLPDYSDSFGPDTGSCDAVPGDHVAACPTGTSCPFVVDVELRCTSTIGGFRHVLSNPEQITLAVSDAPRPWLFDIRSNDDVDVTQLPADAGLPFVAQTPDALFLAQWQESMDRTSLLALVRQGEQWHAESILGRSDPIQSLTMYDFGIVAGQPSAWVVTDRSEILFARSDRGADGQWQDQPAHVVSETRVLPKFRSLDGKTLSFDMSGGTITSVLEGGAPIEWRKPLSPNSWRTYELLPDIELTADDLPMPAILADEAIAVTWGPEAGVEDAAVEMTDLSILDNECDAIREDCSDTCELDEFGTGNTYGGYRVVRTDDGVAWIIASVTHLKESWTYTPGEGEEQEYCVGHPTDDGSTGELRVYRVDAPGAEPVQVLSLATEAPTGADDLAASTSGNDIAIAVGLWDQGRRGPEEFAIRVLRVDTSLLGSE